jgi:GNAT superfamily N-acetyltransferase
VTCSASRSSACSSKRSYGTVNLGGVSIRPAVRADVPDILRLVHALADYEREPDAVEATKADLARALFPDEGSASTFCHVAEVEGDVVGIAVWFLTFSTWTGRNGIWLEDLFVLPEHRGAGLGKALLASLARICVERDLRRLEWTVLDWNTPAVEFYRSLGSAPLEEWTTQRLVGDELERLAGAAS